MSPLFKGLIAEGYLNKRIYQLYNRLQLIFICKQASSWVRNCISNNLSDYVIDFFHMLPPLKCDLTYAL